jgi:GntR family transcriptional regulator
MTTAEHDDGSASGGERGDLGAVFRVRPEDPAPAYVQIERQIRLAVAAGVLQPGDRLPSVRTVAGQQGVSINTIARAYAGLAREGVIRARAGGGSIIAPRESLDTAGLDRAREERLQTLARQIVVRALALGLEPAEIVSAVYHELAARGRAVLGDEILPPLGADEVPLLSARNRLHGTVTGIREGEMLAEVTVHLEHAETVAAITGASLRRLGLRVGGPVTVYVKATEQTLGL